MPCLKIFVKKKNDDRAVQGKKLSESDAQRKRSLVEKMLVNRIKNHF